MPNQENMQKYIDEMMRLYSQNAALNQSNTEQSNTEQNGTAQNNTEQNNTEQNGTAQDEIAAPPLPEVLNITPVELLNTAPEDISAKNEYSEYGFLQVGVAMGEKAYPLENAVVVITQKTSFGQSAVNVSLTDKSGKTPVITLPAPESSEKDGANIPFSTYTAEIFLEGFYTVKNENVPIFSGITSLLTVNMVPLPSNAASRREITFYSDEPQF